MQKHEIIFVNSVFFVLGFVLVFSIIGILLQTILAHISFAAMNVIRIVGGVIILAFGIILLASARYIIPFFSAEHRIHAPRFKNSYLSSLTFGVGFALGWTPCVGPILGAIYALAIMSRGLAFLLLLTYSIGLGIPFLVFGAFISKLPDFKHSISLYLKYFNVIGGAFLIALGVLVITGYIGVLSVFLVTLQTPMSVGTDLNLLAALIAGVLTVLSPCILPLLPAYFAYMAGTASNVVRE